MGWNLRAFMADGIQSALARIADSRQRRIDEGNERQGLGERFEERTTVFR